MGIRRAVLLVIVVASAAGCERVLEVGRARPDAGAVDAVPAADAADVPDAAVSPDAPPGDAPPAADAAAVDAG